MTGSAGGGGLARERTALAWQRTALSLAAASALMARLTWGTVGVAAMATLTIAVVLSCWVFVESRRRDSHDAGAPTAGSSRGGRAPLALAVCIALIAATELAAVLSS